jgi:hypothetical protein
MFLVIEVTVDSNILLNCLFAATKQCNSDTGVCSTAVSAWQEGYTFTVKSDLSAMFNDYEYSTQQVRSKHLISEGFLYSKFCRFMRSHRIIRENLRLRKLETVSFSNQIGLGSFSRSTTKATLESL